MDELIFDKRFHKAIFLKRLILSIFSIAFPIIALLYYIIASIFNIILATNGLFVFIILYIICFMYMSLRFHLTDKKVQYDNKLSSSK